MDLSTISLRRYRPDDVDAVFGAVLESLGELALWMPWAHAHYGRGDAAAWVASRPSAWETGEEWSLLIVDAQDRVLGACGVHRPDRTKQVAEVGYWVRTSATGKGVATTALRRVADWAFRQQGMHRLEVVVVVENVASQRVAERAGAIREGILAERVCLAGQWRDAALWALISGR
jgi:ribosomal-protein-serine acetyltransferase